MQFDNAKLGDRMILDDAALGIAETVLIPYYRDEATKVSALRTQIPCAHAFFDVHRWLCVSLDVYLYLGVGGVGRVVGRVRRCVCRTVFDYGLSFLEGDFKCVCV